jgi:predicted nucleic acid-binding protein
VRSLSLVDWTSFAVMRRLGVRHAVTEATPAG